MTDWEDRIRRLEHRVTSLEELEQERKAASPARLTPAEIRKAEIDHKWSDLRASDYL